MSESPPKEVMAPIPPVNPWHPGVVVAQLPLASGNRVQVSLIRKPTPKDLEQIRAFFALCLETFTDAADQPPAV